MSMPQVSAEQLESSSTAGKRLRTEIANRIAAFTQVRAASLMGVSASTVNRMVDDLDGICHLMAVLGLQFAPLDAVVVEHGDIAALERMAYKYLQHRVESEKGRL
jgi:hypothetical protein